MEVGAGLEVGKFGGQECMAIYIRRVGEEFNRYGWTIGC